ncbi:MAG: LptF/LptG family permease [Spirochaetes bacterium]|nr:LptF/LptG family permease [Spirochaetota bacterium]
MKLKFYRRSSILDIYVLRGFIGSFLVALAFFVMIVQLMDLFSNIFKYLQNDVPAFAIVETMLYYIPKSVSYSLPISILFAVSYTLGMLYANNELIVIYASGIPLSTLITPVFLLAFSLSVVSFFFEDRIVLPTTETKKSLSRNLLVSSGTDYNASDIVILGEGKRFIWNITYYNDAKKELSGIILVERDESGKFVSRLNAQSAVWDGSTWLFKSVRRFYIKGSGLQEELYAEYTNAAISENPDSFRGRNKDIENMNINELNSYIGFLERAGLPVSAAKVEYFQRFAFSCTPVIVMLLAAVFAGRVKKNILLMSLLFSLLSATLYYVIQMISVLLAKNEIIPPLVGAFTAIIIITLTTLPMIFFRKA